MRQGGRAQDCARSDVLLSVGSGFRLLASFLFLVWAIQVAMAVQSGLAFAKGEDRIAAAEPAVQPTILVRDVARHLGAEASRFKANAYAHPTRGDGKPVAIAAESRIQFAGEPWAVLCAWPDIRPELPPIHAFLARAPPIYRA